MSELDVDNSSARRHSVFFYGLYMDEKLLQQQAVSVVNPRKACLPGFRLRVGQRATLLRDPQASAHGMVYDLTHEEIHRLYWGAGLHEYAAEAVMLECEGQALAALCCNLIEAPAAGENNPAYVEKLLELMKRLELPLPQQV